MNLHRLLGSAEEAGAVDRPAAAIAGSIRRVLRKSRAYEVLRGSWLGHPLHPLMVTVPIGAWVCSAVLDLGKGNEEGARKLVGIGLVAAPPTVVLGLADYAELDERQRRVGLIHAGLNTVGLSLFAASYRCRLRGDHGAGKALGAVGLAVLSAGGALGGHLSYAQGAGVHRWS